MYVRLEILNCFNNIGIFSHTFAYFLALLHIFTYFCIFSRTFAYFYIFLHNFTKKLNITHYLILNCKQNLDLFSAPFYRNDLKIELKNTNVRPTSLFTPRPSVTFCHSTILYPHPADIVYGRPLSFKLAFFL